MDRREILAGNLVDGVDRYSIHSKSRIMSHDLQSTPGSKQIAYSMSALDEGTIVAGHNEALVTIIMDHGRSKGSARYKIEYVTLTRGSDGMFPTAHLLLSKLISLRATHIVVAGQIQGKTVILAVNGYGAHSRLFIVTVNYLQDQIGNSIAPVSDF